MSMASVSLLSTTASRQCQWTQLLLWTLQAPTKGKGSLRILAFSVFAHMMLHQTRLPQEVITWGVRGAV